MTGAKENDIRVVSIKEAVLADNKVEADAMRDYLNAEGAFMLNVMGSPGAGKTTFLLDVFKRLPKGLRVGVIEGDIASTADAQRMQNAGIDTVQLRTGGACHIDVPMVREALAAIGVNHDLLVIENVGNLVCPAEFDTGAHANVMLLSVPEGWDKVLKYPLMFTVCDALVISKCDTKVVFDDFDAQAVRDNARKLNPRLEVFEVSAKTGEGMDAWRAWLTNRMTIERKKKDGKISQSAQTPC